MRILLALLFTTAAVAHDTVPSDFTGSYQGPGFAGSARR